MRLNFAKLFLMTQEAENTQISFRSLLQNEYSRRARRNPRYSIRAFARQMGVDQSYLSKHLRGKREFSQATILKIGDRLGLPKRQLKYFTRKSASADPSYSYLEDDSFVVISEWYHFPILELLSLKSFKPNVSSIARALEITETEAQFAIERLERLGLIKKENDRYFATNENNSWMRKDQTSEDRRALQIRLLEKAIEAVESTPFEYRDQSSLTVAIRRAELPEFKKLITEFRRRLNDLAESSSEKDEVYQLLVSFFPISRTGGSENEK